jgi:hypothetical protein
MEIWWYVAQVTVNSLVFLSVLLLL